MSLRQLVEGDCGGANPLMQLGGQFTRDAAHKDEGFAQAHFERGMRQDQEMVSEFLGQVAGPPQSFQMQTLLQEMREIEQANATQLQAAPRVIDEVAGQWSKDFVVGQAPMLMAPIQMMHMQPQQQQVKHVSEFFDEMPSSSNMQMMRAPTQQYFQVMPTPYLAMAPSIQQQQQQRHAVGATDQFFAEASNITDQTQLPKAMQAESIEDWINDYEVNKDESEKTASNYNEKFWQRLQDEWAKMSEDSEYPWLNEYSDNFDPYKEYQFAEENPMSELDNALEKGKEYLARGDIPSAVLCFEVAAKKQPENAEVWELLGISQAENEMDPQSIAALKRAVSLQPDNRRVLMALAVSYTNESLHSQAVNMLTQWLAANPKYKHLIPTTEAQGDITMASSLIRGNKLLDLQELYLQAVRMQPTEIDAEIQEALGVLYNLSSEFDKAVDCFRAALHENPNNAKVWNRLGASLANGSRSVEAVEAYQHALQLQPGFIRVRYNVGVCCMNLKAYKQAVEHLLTALNMQANTAAQRELYNGVGAVGAGQQQMSESIWITLKMVISLMGRNDLQGIVRERNLTALNDAFKEINDMDS